MSRLRWYRRGRLNQSSAQLSSPGVLARWARPLVWVCVFVILVVGGLPMMDSDWTAGDDLASLSMMTSLLRHQQQQQQQRNGDKKIRFPPACPARALVGFLPSDPNHVLNSNYTKQLRWLIMSWSEMRQHLNATALSEPGGCRVDILVVTKDMHESLHAYGCVQAHKNPNDDELGYGNGVSGDLSRCLILPGYKPRVQLPNRYMDSIESINFAFEAFPTLMHGYDWVLRSDLDVFLTPRFASWIPRRFTVGNGAFCFPKVADTCQRLKRIGVEQKWLKNETKMVDNVGSSWYGPPDAIQKCARLSMEVAQFLDEHEFTLEEKNSFGWPKWHYGVLSMYAGQIAINSCTAEIGGFVKSFDMLDFPSESDGVTRSHAHIHTYPGYRFFNKLDFLRGRYKHIKLHALDRSIVSKYAGYMALASLNESLFQQAIAMSK